MDNRELAKQLKNNKQYDKAAPLFKDLWKKEQLYWDGWNYVHCLYLQGILDVAFNASFQIYKDNPGFLYNLYVLLMINTLKIQKLLLLVKKYIVYLIMWI